MAIIGYCDVIKCGGLDIVRMYVTYPVLVTNLCVFENKKKTVTISCPYMGTKQLQSI